MLVELNNIRGDQKHPVCVNSIMYIRPFQKEGVELGSCIHFAYNNSDSGRAHFLVVAGTPEEVRDEINSQVLDMLNRNGIDVNIQTEEHYNGSQHAVRNETDSDLAQRVCREFRQEGYLVPLDVVRRVLEKV